MTEYIQLELEIRAPVFTISGDVIETLENIEGTTHNHVLHGTTGFYVMDHRVSLLGRKYTVSLELWFDSKADALLLAQRVRWASESDITLLNMGLFDDAAYKGLWVGNGA